MERERKGNVPTKRPHNRMPKTSLSHSDETAIRILEEASKDLSALQSVVDITDSERIAELEALELKRDWNFPLTLSIAT